ncbi:MAG: cytochrome c family protein [Rhodospirillales bacterium]|nr:cytochrome c family protein [Rhodospirillales bacterium]
MWSMKTNVVFGAILMAAWMIWGTNYVGNILIPHIEIVHSDEDAAAPAAAQKAPEPVVPFPVLLAEATVKRGERVAKKCISCHTFASGDKNKVGPNLWSVFTRDRAGADGFSYSSAMAGLGGKWTLEDMDKFLLKPKAFLKGTKMAFAGLRKPTDRAAVIVYMRGFDDSPVPLPAP